MRYANNQVSFSFSLTPWVKRLLIANVVVFLLTMVDPAFFFQWFSFSPTRFLTQPWGAITYMFLHAGFGHLFWNMLLLFFFGPPLESRWGSNEFLRFYIICGLGGVALSFLFVSNQIVGASAALYGLMLAFAMTWPNAPIYIWGVFPVKAKWMLGALFVLSLWQATVGPSGGIAHLAHLGGIITGFLYLKSDWRPESIKKGRKRGIRVRRMAIVPKEAPPQDPPQAQPPSGEWSEAEDPVLDEVDRILDKISAEGMSSLTSGERKVLDEVSRRHRSN